MGKAKIVDKNKMATIHGQGCRTSFFSREMSDKKQIVDRVLNLAEIVHERRFVKKNIIPHFGNPEILLSYLYK
jgi:hypothetical protein